VNAGRSFDFIDPGRARGGESLSRPLALAAVGRKTSFGGGAAVVTAALPASSLRALAGDEGQEAVEAEVITGGTVAE